MRVFGLVVTKDEGHRYLDACLAWHVPMLDKVLVYDDGSTDNTPNICKRHGVHFCKRGDSVPTFMQDEGAFRNDSNLTLEKTFDLEPGDWILSFDADEFLTCVDSHDEGSALRAACAAADSQGAKSVLLPRPEIWQVNPPMIRVDGLWNTIKCTRLWRWEPGGKIQDKAMGCGSEPTYVGMSAKSPHNLGLHLLHYGYANWLDLIEKHQRYSTIAHGHNEAHIGSIVIDPTLAPWEHRTPAIWRSERSNTS